MKNIVKIFTVLFLTLNIMPSIANDEKQQAYDDAYATEQSKANRLLTSASSAATGIGGMELAQGLSEQKADRTAEQSMSAYISTMRCEYGNGKQVKAGMDEIELPGGNDANLMKYRAEYMSLSADLKERKTALGLKPGIESEEILDKSQMGLYDDSNVGINGGRYASLYRAQMLGSETDQEQIDSAKQTSKNRVIGGAVAAGVGVVGGIVGDELINQSLSSSTKTAQNCTESGGTWQGGRCNCPDGFIQHTKTGPCFEEKPTEVQTTTNQQTPVNQENPTTKNNTANLSNGSNDSNSDQPGNGQSGSPTNPVVDSTDVNSADNFEFEIDESLWMDENEFNEAIASQKETPTNPQATSESDQSTSQVAILPNGQVLPANLNLQTPSITGSQDVATQRAVEAVFSNGATVTSGSTAPTNNSGSLTDPSANTGDNNGTGSNSGSNGENNPNVTANAATNATSTTSNCGNVGQKECTGKYKYYVCETNDDCTSEKGTLPSNATTGHCVSADREGYKICTATACENPYEPKSGYCQKRAISDRNTDSQKSNTQTAKRANNTGRTTQQNTNSNMVVGYNADGTCDIYKNQQRQTTDVSVCNGLSKSQWRSNGKQGISKCASNSDAFGKTAPEGDTGRDCWCKINNQKSWVYVGATTFTKDCPTNCAYSCAYHYYEGAFK